MAYLALSLSLLVTVSTEEYIAGIRPIRAFRTVGVSGLAGAFSASFIHFTDRAGHVRGIQRKYALLYLLSGSGRYISPSGQAHVLGPGSLLHRFEGEQFDIYRVPDNTWLEFALILPAPLVESLLALGTLRRDRRVLEPGLAMILLRRCSALRDNLAAAGPGDVPHLLAEAHSLIVAMQDTALERDRNQPNSVRIAEACRLLAENLDLRIGTPDLLAPLGLGYERLRKVFREHIGCAPHEYRLRRRIDHARLLLAGTNVPLKEIADRLGYPDTPSFAKQFKKMTGTTPGAFRASD